MTTTSLDLSHYNLGLQQIIARYGDIEDEIATRAFVTALSEVGAIAGSRILTVGGMRVMASSEVSETKRTFTISLLPLQRVRSVRIDSSEQVLGAGVVRTVTITHPRSIGRAAKTMLVAASEAYREGYSVLERAFIRGCSDLQRGLLADLRPILALALEREGIDIAKVNCHLTITSIKSGKYNTVLDGDLIATLLRAFRERDDLPYSALECVITLLCEQGFDGWVKTGLLSADQFTAIPFAELFQLNVNEKLTLVETFMYSHESLASREICRVNDLSLQANCPVSRVDLLERAIRRCGKSLEETFSHNFRSLSKQRAQFAASWNASLQARGRWAAGFRLTFIEILSKTLAEILKGGGGPY